MLQITQKTNTIVTAFLLCLAICALVLIPFFSFAQTNTQTTANNPLVPCTNTGVGDAPPTGADLCDWNALMKLVNNVISFILFKMLVPIAAIMFAYCGFILLTAGGESAKKTKAKNIFSNVVWGLIIAIAAWLIVQTILHLLGYNGAWIGF